VRKPPNFSLDVREQLGNHIFLDSGLLRTFDQLERDDIGVPAKSWFEDYFFDTHGVTSAQLLADRALELAQRTDRGRPQAWDTALFASQHELFAYRKQAADGTPVMGDRAGLVRAIAQWLLPYGVQRQMRQAWTRRSAVRQQDEAQMTGATPDLSERQPSQTG
jgi:hypothetical protein